MTSSTKQHRVTFNTNVITTGRWPWTLACRRKGHNIVMLYYGNDPTFIHCHRCGFLGYRQGSGVHSFPAGRQEIDDWLLSEIESGL